MRSRLRATARRANIRRYCITIRGSKIQAKENGDTLEHLKKAYALAECSPGHMIEPAGFRNHLRSVNDGNVMQVGWSPDDGLSGHVRRLMALPRPGDALRLGFGGFGLALLRAVVFRIRFGLARRNRRAV